MRRVVLFIGSPATLSAFVEVLRDGGYLVEMITKWAELAPLVRLAPQAVLIDLDARRSVDGMVVFPAALLREFPPIVGIGQGVRAPRGLAAVVPKPVRAKELLVVLARVIETAHRRRSAS